MLLVYKIVLRTSMTITKGKSTKRTAVKGELKGMSPIIAVLVRRLRIRIFLFLEILAERPVRGFCKSANKGLW